MKIKLLAMAITIPLVMGSPILAWSGIAELEAMSDKKLADEAFGACLYAREHRFHMGRETMGDDYLRLIGQLFRLRFGRFFKKEPMEAILDAGRGGVFDCKETLDKLNAEILRARQQLEGRAQ